jgi:hypothetical protein
MFGTRKAPTYSRIDQNGPYDSGRDSLRSILMWAMREDASRVSIKPHQRHPSLIHAVRKFRHEKPVNTLSPGMDELMAHLAALPSRNLALNLDDLVDEYLSEYQPRNNLAHEQIVWFRAAPYKNFEILIEVDQSAREAEIVVSR